MIRILKNRLFIVDGVEYHFRKGEVHGYPPHVEHKAIKFGLAEAYEPPKPPNKRKRAKRKTVVK